MNQSFKSLLLLLALIASLVVVASACWHSLEDLDYFKSFYPEDFTVTEAFYASAVELIKVTIISLPFFLLVFVSLHLLRLNRRQDD